MTQTEIKSEVTGTVWSVVAAPGDRLDEDDPIIMVESMKMEIPVCAPRAGTIAQIKVSEGDSVETGQVIAVLSS
jgi:biotin carboxyl carrier protein